MSATPRAVLRYFDARGRAQFVRHYLACREVDYADERVALSPGFEAWQAMRGDRSLTGPFHKLPVLHWGDLTVAETLVIQSFLHRASGDEALLDARDNLRHAMLVSSLYNDVMMQIGILIWADLMFRGVDVVTHSRGMLARLRAQLVSYERTLEEWEWRHAADRRPVMLADCLLWEELDVVRHVFREHLPLDDFPTLARLYHEAPARAVFNETLARPVPITGRGFATEAERLAEIRAALAA